MRIYTQLGAPLFDLACSIQPCEWFVNSYMYTRCICVCDVFHYKIGHTANIRYRKFVTGEMLLIFVFQLFCYVKRIKRKKIRNARSSHLIFRGCYALHMTPFCLSFLLSCSSVVQWQNSYVSIIFFYLNERFGMCILFAQKRETIELFALNLSIEFKCYTVFDIFRWKEGTCFTRFQCQFHIYAISVVDCIINTEIWMKIHSKFIPTIS